jgi:hypothetical protein
MRQLYDEIPERRQSEWGQEELERPDWLSDQSGNEDDKGRTGRSQSSIRDRERRGQSRSSNPNRERAGQSRASSSAPADGRSRTASVRARSQLQNVDRSKSDYRLRMTDEEREEAAKKANSEEGRKWIISARTAVADAAPAADSDAGGASASQQSEVVTFNPTGDFPVSIDDDLRVTGAGDDDLLMTGAGADDDSQHSANHSSDSDRGRRDDDAIIPAPVEGKGELTQRGWEEQEDQMRRSERSVRLRSEPRSSRNDSRTAPRSSHAAPYHRPQEQRRDQSRVTTGSRSQLSPMPDYIRRRSKRANGRSKSANGYRQARARDRTHRDHNRNGDRPAQCRDRNKTGDLPAQCRDHIRAGQSSVVVGLDGDAMTTTNDSVNLCEDRGCARLVRRTRTPRQLRQKCTETLTKRYALRWGRGAAPAEEGNQRLVLDVAPLVKPGHYRSNTLATFADVVSTLNYCMLSHSGSRS